MWRGLLVEAGADQGGQGMSARFGQARLRRLTLNNPPRRCQIDRIVNRGFHFNKSTTVHLL
jgi:hypothetical protein